MKCVLYILQSDISGRYYIGHTNNLERRMKEHNDSGSKSWTKYHQPWSVVYTEEFKNRGQAMNKERHLKSLKSRVKIEEYIAG